MQDPLIQKIINRLYGLKIKYNDGDDYIVLEDVTDISYLYKLMNVLNNLKKYRYNLQLKIDTYLNNNASIKNVDDMVYVSKLKSLDALIVLLSYIEIEKYSDIIYYVDTSNLDRELANKIIKNYNNSRVKVI